MYNHIWRFGYDFMTDNISITCDTLNCMSVVEAWMKKILKYVDLIEWVNIYLEFL